MFVFLAFTYAVSGFIKGPELHLDAAAAKHEEVMQRVRDEDLKHRMDELESLRNAEKHQDLHLGASPVHEYEKQFQKHEAEARQQEAHLLATLQSEDIHAKAEDVLPALHDAVHGVHSKVSDMLESALEHPLAENGDHHKRLAKLSKAIDEDDDDKDEEEDDSVVDKDKIDADEEKENAEIKATEIAEAPEIAEEKATVPKAQHAGVADGAEKTEEARLAAVENEVLSKLGKSVKMMSMLHVMMAPIAAKLRASMDRLPPDAKERANEMLSHLDDLAALSHKAEKLVESVRDVQGGTAEQKKKAIINLMTGMQEIQQSVQKNLVAMKPSAPAQVAVTARIQDMLTKMQTKVDAELADPARQHDPMVMLDIEMLATLKKTLSKTHALLAVAANALKGAHGAEEKAAVKEAAKAGMKRMLEHLKDDMKAMKMKAVLLSVVVQMQKKKTEEMAHGATEDAESDGTTSHAEESDESEDAQAKPKAGMAKKADDSEKDGKMPSKANEDSDEADTEPKEAEADVDSDEVAQAGIKPKAAKAEEDSDEVGEDAAAQTVKPPVKPAMHAMEDVLDPREVEEDENVGPFEMTHTTPKAAVDSDEVDENVESKPVKPARQAKAAVESDEADERDAVKPAKHQAEPAKAKATEEEDSEEAKEEEDSDEVDEEDAVEPAKHKAGPAKKLVASHPNRDEDEADAKPKAAKAHADSDEAEEAGAKFKAAKPAKHAMEDEIEPAVVEDHAWDSDDAGSFGWADATKADEDAEDAERRARKAAKAEVDSGEADTKPKAAKADGDSNEENEAEVKPKVGKADSDEENEAEVKPKVTKGDADADEENEADAKPEEDNNDATEEIEESGAPGDIMKKLEADMAQIRAKHGRTHRLHLNRHHHFLEDLDDKEKANAEDDQEEPKVGAKESAGTSSADDDEQKVGAKDTPDDDAKPKVGAKAKAKAEARHSDNDSWMLGGGDDAKPKADDAEPKTEKAAGEIADESAFKELEDELKKFKASVPDHHMRTMH